MLPIRMDLRSAFTAENHSVALWLTKPVCYPWNGPKKYEVCCYGRNNRTEQREQCSSRVPNYGRHYQAKRENEEPNAHTDRKDASEAFTLIHGLDLYIRFVELPGCAPCPVHALLTLATLTPISLAIFPTISLVSSSPELDPF